MIKKLAKFFCLSPLILALVFTHLSMSGFANQTIAAEESAPKDKSKFCVEKLKAQRKKIKQEIDLIRKMIKDKKK
jgi:uncharacterized SAM-binding protein YcdF (DUF218 family)